MPGAQPDTGRSATRVLIVDDHAMFREPLKVALEQHGFAVDLADSGDAALAALNRAPPDLILLDLKMPGMGGPEFLSILRRNPVHRDVPVVALTMRADRASVVAVAHLGVSGYLLKERCSLDRLLDVARSAVRREHPPHRTYPAGIGPSHRPGTGSPAEAGNDGGETSGDDQLAAIRSINPVTTRDAVLRRVTAAGPLRVMSPVLAEVIRVTEDPSCTIETAAAAIAQDPAMALRIIALANSSAYSRGGSVESLRRAVVQIGVRNVRQTVLTFGIVDRFASFQLTGDLEAGDFWEHAYSCAAIASEIARVTSPDDSDAAFLCGLLHDLGRAVLAEVLGDVYARILQTARQLRLPVEQVETRMLGLNHAEVMGPLVGRWGLPDSISNPIIAHHAHLHRSALSRDPGRAAIDRLVAADRLANAWMLGSSGNDTVYPTEDLCRGLGLDSGIVHQIEGRLASLNPDIKHAILPGVPRNSDPSRRRGHLLVAPFRPVFVGDETAVESVRLWCARLGKSSGPGRPTLIVAAAQHIPVTGLASQLRNAERHAGASALPALLVDPPEDTIGIVPSLERRVCIVHRPAAVSRLIVAINQLHDGHQRAA